MILYHFCSNKDAKGIFKEGITTGCLTVPATMQMLTPYIWLTKDADPARQSWATRHLVYYSRTVWRFTVDIPEEYEYRLMDRAKIEEQFPSTGALYYGCAGSENWLVYHGTIPTRWIRAVERMEDTEI